MVTKGISTTGDFRFDSSDLSWALLPVAIGGVLEMMRRLNLITPELLIGLPSAGLGIVMAVFLFRGIHHSAKPRTADEPTKWERR